MEHFEKTLSSQRLFEGRVINLRRDEAELENGARAFREVVEHPGGVAVLAITGQDEVLFVRQFRYPMGRVLLELPAGKLEKGEDPALCGMRELEEETGFAADELKPLGQFYPTPGYTNEVLYIFLAQTLTPGRQKLDADEFLSVIAIPFEKALQMCLQGEIEDAKTLIALLKYAELRRRESL